MKELLYRDPWIFCPRPNPSAQMRLFCFPYAGGTAALFRSWPENLPADVEVVAVQLPGRLSRHNHAPFTRLAPLLHALEAALLPYLNEPFAFFGHSMGALISFELARQLRRSCDRHPIHLFAAGRRAPQIPDADAPIYHLPDDSFIAELHQLNGISDLVMQDAQLLQLVLPTLRADVELCETYTYVEEAPLDCSITVLGGLNDTMVPQADLAAWKEQTTAGCTLRMFTGDHFFVQSARKQVVGVVGQDLSRLLQWLPAM